MSKFPFVCTPENLAYGDKPTWVSATDGDTPTVQLPIRMLGMDAPELHYGGASENKPGKFDTEFGKFLNSSGKNLDSGLKTYLAARLKSNSCTRHINAGKAASDFFTALVTKRLDRGLGKNGKPLKPRHLFVMASTEVFDRYGRLLAYICASYTKKERESIPPGKRPTFNLEMIQEGHAVSLIIYPNIPKPTDLELVQDAVAKARKGHKGIWKGSPEPLLPYEFRWIVDTIAGAHDRKGPDRYCGDITSANLYPPQLYYKALPENRLFFFPEDLGDAYTMGFKLVT